MSTDHLTVQELQCLSVNEKLFYCKIPFSLVYLIRNLPSGTRQALKTACSSIEQCTHFIHIETNSSRWRTCEQERQTPNMLQPVTRRQFAVGSVSTSITPYCCRLPIRHTLLDLQRKRDVCLSGGRIRYHQRPLWHMQDRASVFHRREREYTKPRFQQPNGGNKLRVWNKISHTPVDSTSIECAKCRVPSTASLNWCITVLYSIQFNVLSFIDSVSIGGTAPPHFSEAGRFWKPRMRATSL